MKALKRTIFGIVGIAGVYALGYMVLNWSYFWHTMGWTGLPYILLMIGGLNWGIVSISGNADKDILSWLKIK